MQLPLFAPRRGGIHYARLESSPRLQRLLAVLRRGGKFSTRQIVEQAHVMAVSACVAELREQGIAVGCERINRTTWLYWLENNGGTE